MGKITLGSLPPQGSADYQPLFESLPGLLLVVLPDHNSGFPILFVSRAFAAWARIASAETSGRPLFDVLPQDYDLMASLVKVLATGEPDIVIGAGRRSTQTPVTAPDGNILHLIHHVELTSEPESASATNEAYFRFLTEFDDATRSLADPAEITLTAARILGEHLRVNRCAYADVEKDEDTFNLTGDYNHGTESIVGRYTFTQFGAECLRLMRAGEPFVVADSELDDRVSSVVESFRMTRIRAVICVPLLKAGHFVAAMAVHQTTPRAWRQVEVGLVQSVASRCWESIERTRVTRELREREQEIRFTLEAGLMGVWGLDLRNNQAWRSPMHDQIFGYHEMLPDWTYETFLSHVVPQDRNFVHRCFQQSLTSGEEWEFQCRIHRCDGRVSWIWRRGQVHLDREGKPARMLGVVRDITDRKHAEEALLESKERFRQAIDSMPQLVWSTRPDGYHDLFNRQWSLYTGLSPEESEGDKWSKAFYPDDLVTARERWRQALTSGNAYEVEYRCRRHDGEYRWFLGRAEPVRDEDGELVRWFGTCTDIHAQKTAQHELRLANADLEEFAYVASHDLQEPLRMVNIYTQLLTRSLEPHLDARSREFAGEVTTGVKRMEHLLRGLLTFSRTIHRAAEDALARPQADLNVSLAKAIEVLSSRIEGENAQVTFDRLPVVGGDEAQLAQVFQNLLSNALKYRRTGESASVHICAEEQAGDWIVSVRDNGIGFDQKYADRVFGLFKRLHKEYEGTGLGLAICKRIIERFGGTIWAEARPDRGATFFFALPNGKKDDRAHKHPQ